ncbi:MAG: SHOCT domain-containing protein [Fulvivirga sp.]
MKNVLLSAVLVVAFGSGCATIVGGSKYSADVMVDDHSNADIYYNNRQYGKGYASIRIPRKEADKITFTVKKEGCEDQDFKYVSRKLRGWAIAGTIFTWTGNPIPIPYGLIVDLATGAVYKPDASEPGVRKDSYKRFEYTLDYTGCGDLKSNPIPQKKSEFTKEERLRELKLLFDQGLITEEEYAEQKKRILEES